MEMGLLVKGLVRTVVGMRKRGSLLDGCVRIFWTPCVWFDEQGNSVRCLILFGVHLFEPYQVRLYSLRIHMF